MAKVSVLGKQAAEYLKRSLSNRPKSDRVLRRFREGPSSFVLLVRAPVGGIPARSGIDAGVESCSIMQKNADDEIVDTGNVVDVYSWAAFSACANGSRLGLAHRDKYGTYWIGSEDCEDVTDSF